MTPQVIASALSDHRPYPRPLSLWVAQQAWDRLIFLHWPVSPEVIQSQLPSALQMDKYDGGAWIGVVAFDVQEFRIPGGIPIPGMSHFPQLNVRTYVSYQGRPGIYMFSLDTPNSWVNFGARQIYHLPYQKASLDLVQEGPTSHIRHYRPSPDGRDISFEATYGPTAAPVNAVKGSLEYWLVERYCVYAVNHQGRVYRAEIDHPPWALQGAMAQIHQNTLIPNLLGPITLGSPLCHYAHHQTAHIWFPQRVA